MRTGRMLTFVFFVFLVQARNKHDGNQPTLRKLNASTTTVGFYQRSRFTRRLYFLFNENVVLSVHRFRSDHEPPNPTEVLENKFFVRTRPDPIGSRGTGRSGPGFKTLVVTTNINVLPIWGYPIGLSKFLYFLFGFCFGTVTQVTETYRICVGSYCLNVWDH